MAALCGQRTCFPCWRNASALRGWARSFGGRRVIPSGFRAGRLLSAGLKFAFLHGVGARPNSDYSYWVSQNVFAMYQLMFAIITPALIIGAVAERMKFAAVLVFVGIWMFVVYFPIAHMVWGIDGWMNG